MIIKYLWKRKFLLLCYIAVAVIAPSVNTWASIYSGYMLDHATAGDLSSFLGSLKIFVIYFFLHGLLLFLIRVCRKKLISLCRRELKKEMFAGQLQGSGEYFSRTDSGELIAAFSNDITLLETGYFDPWFEIFESILSVATALLAIFTLETSMAWIIVVGECFSLLICFLLRPYSSARNGEYICCLASFTQKVKDYFAALPVIKNYSKEAMIRKVFGESNGETEARKDIADMSVVFADTLAKVCNSLIKFILVGYGVTLMMGGRMTVGVIFTAYRHTDQLVAPIHSVISHTNSIQAVQAVSRRIRKMCKKTKDPIPTQSLYPNPSGGLILQDVSLKIEGKMLLQDVSFSFLPGKKYLILGKNGAGKSTMLRLLKGSTKDYEGQIFVEGRELRSLSREEVNGKIGYINESVSLLCDTVRNNLCLYRNIPNEQISRVLKQVGLQVELERVIRDGDRNLSSGEIRRLEIARSLLQETETVIYDEAISTLDIPTAYEIEKMLLSLQEQTVIFVSHNFSGKLIGCYDEILLMEDGRITDHGTHEKLLETNAYYRYITDLKNGRGRAVAL